MAGQWLGLRFNMISFIMLEQFQSLVFALQDRTTSSGPVSVVLVMWTRMMHLSWMDDGIDEVFAN